MIYAPAAASERRSEVAEGDRERAARWGNQRGPTERSYLSACGRKRARSEVAEGDRERAARWGNYRGPTERSYLSACGRKRAAERSRRRRPRARSEVGKPKGPHRAKLSNGAEGRN